MARELQVKCTSKGKVVLATVYGDVHDIGKNLVNTILSNNGYTVYDLGKQVPVNTIIEKWGGIDPLVCNAASTPHFGPLATASDEVFDKIMETNVKSVFWLGNMVLPQMAERGQRRQVNE